MELWEPAGSIPELLNDSKWIFRTVKNSEAPRGARARASFEGLQRRGWRAHPVLETLKRGRKMKGWGRGRGSEGRDGGALPMIKSMLFRVQMVGKWISMSGVSSGVLEVIPLCDYFSGRAGPNVHMYSRQLSKNCTNVPQGRKQQDSSPESRMTILTIPSSKTHPSKLPFKANQEDAKITMKLDGIIALDSIQNLYCKHNPCSHRNAAHPDTTGMLQLEILPNFMSVLTHADSSPEAWGVNDRTKRGIQKKGLLKSRFSGTSCTFCIRALCSSQ